MSLLCRESLAVCDLLIHPRIPSLQRTAAPLHPIASNRTFGTTSRGSQVEGAAGTESTENPSIASSMAGSASSQLVTDSTGSVDFNVSQDQGLPMDTATGSFGLISAQPQLVSDKLPSQRLAVTRKRTIAETSSEQVVVPVAKIANQTEYAVKNGGVSEFREGHEDVQADISESRSAVPIAVEQSEDVSVSSCQNRLLGESCLCFFGRIVREKSVKEKWMWTKCLLLLLMHLLTLTENNSNVQNRKEFQADFQSVCRHNNDLKTNLLNGSIQLLNSLICRLTKF